MTRFSGRGGLAVPWGVPVRRNGFWFQFSRGSLVWTDPAGVKLLIRHDHSQIVGRAIELLEADEGLFAQFELANAKRARVAALIDAGYTGLSVGLQEPQHFTERDGIWHADPGNLLIEISLTPTPGFDTARISEEEP